VPEATVVPEPQLPSGYGVDVAAARLAVLLTGGGTGLSDPTGIGLVFEPDFDLRPLRCAPPPSDAWAVDGGQALVADARCLQVVVTRASRVRFRSGECVLEEEGPLRTQLLGGAEQSAARAALGVTISSDSPVDANLLRDRWEWDAVERCVAEADRGAVVLVDGDLQTDWRIPPSYLAGLLDRADDREVIIAAVTKHSSLSRGGAPLLGHLEREGEVAVGLRSRWWAKLAHTRPDCDLPAIQVVAARLDPDARFAFRVDLPIGADPEEVLPGIAALCDDAAFPGYPYPLTVADRLAACPRWLRDDIWLELDEHLDAAGVAFEVRERAFADRHRLMERA